MGTVARGVGMQLLLAKLQKDTTLPRVRRPRLRGLAIEIVIIFTLREKSGEYRDRSRRFGDRLN